MSMSLRSLYRERFPDDFMFVLDAKEFQTWRSQFVTSKEDRKGLRYAPMAFTEHGGCDRAVCKTSNTKVQVDFPASLLIMGRKVAFSGKERA